LLVVMHKAAAGVNPSHLEVHIGTDGALPGPSLQRPPGPGTAGAAARHRLRPVVGEPLQRAARRPSLRFAAAAIIPAADVVSVGAGAWLVLPHVVWALAYAGAVLAMLRAGGSDGARLDPRLGDDVPKVLRSVAIPLLLLGPLLAGGHGGLTALRLAPVLFGLACAGRLVAYATVRRLRARGVFTEDALVLGAGQVGQGLTEALLTDRRYGLRPIGFLEDDPYDRLSLPVLGRNDRLGPVLAVTGVRRVVVAFGSASDASMVSVLRACDDAKVVVYVLPRFFELGLGAQFSDVDEVRAISLIRLRRRALRRSARAIKRGFDILVATAALLVVSPVMGVAALAVRLSGPGPVLFRQRRLGRNGRAFDVLKFRSMEVSLDADTSWGSASDPRVTRVGRILRRTSMDELPQLWNVLRGDMSIVGPRPERPHFSRIFGESIPGYEDRLRVPAGLTGWSQVHGLRGDTSISDRAFFDNYYVEHWSLWLDIQIIVRTIRTLLVHEAT
jgi:exopolysaccharide biosynthesis polyprenyl glycosylphosphotransferase